MTNTNSDAGGSLRLLVFGGSGNSGTPLVEQALAQGHRVTAVVRDASRLAVEHTNLEVAEGELDDSNFLNDIASRGFDAALSTLGFYHRQHATPLADLTRPIVEALEAHKIHRFICMTSLGCGDSAGQGNAIVRFMQRVGLKYALPDKEAQEELIRDSSLQWTLLRPPRLISKASKGEIIRWEGAAPERRIRWEISFAEAAEQMLAMLGDPSSVNKGIQIAQAA